MTVSVVEILADVFAQVKMDLSLPENKRFVRTVKLFGPIDPSRSSYMILGTKVCYIYRSIP